MREAVLYVLAVFGLTGCGTGGTPDSTPPDRDARPWGDSPGGRPEVDAGWTTVWVSDLPWRFDIGNDVAEGEDGTTFVAGGPYRDDGSVNRNFAVLKIGRDGTPDVSFGAGGLAVSFQNWRSGEALDVLTLDRGTVACGKIFDEGTSFFALARLNASGEPAGFSEGSSVPGERIISESHVCRAIAAGPNETYVAGGDVADGHAFWRFREDGSPDPSFGDAGRAVIPHYLEDSCCIKDISIADDGTIVGLANSYVFKVRADGTLDQGFGDGGYLWSQDRPLSIQLDSVGRVLLSGWREPHQPFVARYLNDGRPDETFGDLGTATVDRDGAFKDTDLDGDGLVAVGISADGGLLVRFDESGRVDSSIGALDSLIEDAAQFFAVEAFADGSFVISGFHPLLVRYPRPSESPE